LCHQRHDTFSAPNATINIRQPGSALTRWGSWHGSPRPSSWI